MRRRKLSEAARMLLIDACNNLRRGSGRGGVTKTAHEQAVAELRARRLLWVVTPKTIIGGFANEDFEITVIPSPRGERVAATLPRMSRGDRLVLVARESSW